MSKNINVNPGQYKVAGRERLGETLSQGKDKAAYVKNREHQQMRQQGKKKR